LVTTGDFIVKNTLRSPYFLALFAALSLGLAPLGCGEPATDDDDETSGDGDGDAPGDGDGEPGDGDGEPGDGDGEPGDGDGDPPGDGDGDEPCMGEGENGSACTSGCECLTGSCYNIPFIGGQCGECSVDADCADGGCTPQNPFDSNGPTCNMGEPGGGCETTEVCEDGLTCGNVLSLLGVVNINTCGYCETTADCDGDQICAPLVIIEEFSGINTCIDAGTVEQDSFCLLEGNGDEACASGICSIVDIMGLAQVGSCGECSSDADCGGGTCEAGAFDLNAGALLGSKCI
jgi:hypothetical protein